MIDHISIIIEADSNTRARLNSSDDPISNTNANHRPLTRNVHVDYRVDLILFKAKLDAFKFHQFGMTHIQIGPVDAGRVQPSQIPGSPNTATLPRPGVLKS